MPRLSFNATFADGTDANSELRNFAKQIGLESVTVDRYSFLLLLQLFGAAKSGHLNPAKVVSQIRVLEGLEENNGLKAPTPFKHFPLKGLWHQHYLEDGMSSFIKNLNIPKDPKKIRLPFFEQKKAGAEFAGEELHVTEADVAQIVNDVISSNWERRIEKNSLTGEWLIFAKYESRNYYLCIGKHKSGDDYLRSQIDAVCLKEFPFLQSILNG